MKRFRTLKADEVDARVGTCNQNGFSLLLYKDARCDQNILDEAVGPENWQRRHYEVKGNMFCSVGIYDDAKKDWIWKDDCGTESNTEKEKGEASDSFKRACFNWGIGRELYTSPFIYIKGNTEQKGNRCVPTFRNFKVLILETQDGKISKLQISGDGEVIYEFGMRSNNTNKPSETMTYEKACKYQTKDKRAFNELSDDELLQIIKSSAGQESKVAAKTIMDYRDMQPISEEDGLPF